jgi:TolB-like protein/cytochrome c-type biogenesis protein CcmH/NrfG
MGTPGETTLCFDRFFLDLKRGSLRADDREIELRPKSFEVLRYLVENAGRLVPKDELMRAVWPNVNVTDESVARCVSDVRSALGDDDQRIIKTQLRRGYLFAATVSTPAAERPTAGAASRKGATSGKQAPRFSLVVLPFANLTGDGKEDHLADVITEGLTTYLSRIRDAFVIARSTASTYKRKDVDARQVGRELGVRYVLEGSEQHSDARVRVSAQLIDVETGAHLWADRFDADRADLLQMQDDIVTRLARALQIELAAVEAARAPQMHSANPNAEDLALHAEAIFLRYGPSRGESEATLDLCTRALQLDADNVRALSILAEWYATRLTGMQSADREADIRRADHFASRALAVDPSSYHAHHAKARSLIAQKRSEEAIIEAERSLRLNPGFIPTYLDFCQANLALGLPEKTIEYADRAMRLSPPDPYVYVFYAQEGLAHIMLNQDGRAVASLRRAVANNPAFPTPVAYLTAALALSGQEGEARETLAQYLSLPDTKTRTIAAWKEMAYSNNPTYRAFRDRIHDGLRKAGMPEE